MLSIREIPGFRGAPAASVEATPEPHDPQEEAP